MKHFRFTRLSLQQLLAYQNSVFPVIVHLPHYFLTLLCAMKLAIFADHSLSKQTFLNLPARPPDVPMKLPKRRRRYMDRLWRRSSRFLLLPTIKHDHIRPLPPSFAACSPFYGCISPLFSCSPPPASLSDLTDGSITFAIVVNKRTFLPPLIIFLSSPPTERANEVGYGFWVVCFLPRFSQIKRPCEPPMSSPLIYKALDITWITNLL